MNTTLTIDRLGRQGDGIALTPDGPVYVPFTLAGETVSVSGKKARRHLQQVLEPSPDRRDPICRHFGRCGGCLLQHFDAQAYRDWKRGLVSEALAREEIDVEVAPLVTFPVPTRRRAVFTAIRNGRGGLSFGFSERDSNIVIDIDECPVLLPEIAGRLVDLKRLAAILTPAKGPLKLAVLAASNGLDIAADAGKRPNDKTISRAIALAGEAGFARLSLDSEILAQFTVPLLSCGGTSVSPPPGAFAQAVEGAEESMAAIVGTHLGECGRVSDLFSGFGAFALRLAAHSEVHAAETDGGALDALERAWRETGGRLKRITVERRDLYRRPMMAAELKRFDGAVFDPPRAGAEAQARELAASKVGRLAAVSCNPVTLARDLRILIDGGYRLLSVTPIDQFVFTPHVEAVALLAR